MVKPCLNHNWIAQEMLEAMCYLCENATKLWDCGLACHTEILSRTVTKLGNRTGLKKVTGDTPDISEWTDFKFYQFAWHWDTPTRK